MRSTTLYTGDAVFMPTTLPTATGADMHQAYEQIFGRHGLEVTFTIEGPPLICLTSRLRGLVLA